ncbi:uncharacterized protein LOC130778023 [Actinidia eriantha]|uniref:uncharacterized protein LOC130778023 n=1 Tax=Actinidia eriantha TaxID=165200 RepID=UPI0025879A61|nr:uncharacterized protein LOC130778023 [Actinidia eriantha]
MTHRARNYPSYAMTNSSKSKSHCHLRSISLPCRSHPSTLRIEEGQKKIKAWEASPTPNGERICDALCGLEELYACIDELLKLKLTQQALSLHRHEEWIDEFLRLIDGCGIIREVISQIREHVRDLQSALRRRKGDSSAGSSIARYTCFRNKVKKEAKKLMEEVKQIDKRIEGSSLFGLDHLITKLGSLKMSIEVIENCLECLFRTVIRARASILNVVSL